MSPVDEFLEMKKQAGLWDAVKGFASNPLGKQIAGGAATTAGALAVTGIGVAASKIHDAVAKRQDFKRMMESDPTLHERQAENPAVFNAFYTSLRSVNPTYGRDPIIAGAQMHKMMEDPQRAGLMLASTIQLPRAEQRSGMGLSVSADVGPLSYQRGF